MTIEASSLLFSHSSESFSVEGEEVTIVVAPDIPPELNVNDVALVSWHAKAK